MTSHIRAWKEERKETITKLAKEYPVIAVATLDELPANIMSLVRKRLGNDAIIVVAKTRVVQLAFKETGFDTSKLDPLVKESVAIIFSKKNPFELFSFIKKNKGSASARPGDIATADLIIQAGDSGLPPGPALSTLKAAGLKVKVAGPTIEITDSKLVTKKGEEVTKEVAEVLGKLSMKPMKIGMRVLGVFDKSDDMFYTADILDVDEEELFNKFVLAYQQAINLAVNAEIFNDVSTELIIIKAQKEAMEVEKGVASASPAKAEEVAKGAEPVKETLAEEAKEEAIMEEVAGEEVKEAPVEKTEEPAVETEEQKLDAEAEALEEEVPENKEGAN